MKRSAAQLDPNRRCNALSRYGHRCVMGRDDQSPFCHVHNPDGDYAKQHPHTFRPPVLWADRMNVEMFDA